MLLYMGNMEKGLVPISLFIHRDEKRLRDEARQRGYIRLGTTGFAERKGPEARDTSGNVGSTTASHGRGPGSPVIFRPLFPAMRFFD